MSETKSSLEVAAEAAARVNAMLIAKGKLKLPPPNATSKSSSGLKVGLGDSYTAEVEINDAPLAARNLLTRGITQDEINKLSGAAISTRGRYMNSEEKVTNLNERPLYLHIQATIKDAVEKAVDRVHRVIEQQLRLSFMSPIKWSRVATTAWSSPSNVTDPPPLIPNGPQPTFVQEKVFVGLDHLPPSYEVKDKMLGPSESYLNHIRTETGANVTLRGKGSGHVEPTSGRESFEPLHLFLTHSKVDGLQAAKDLAVNLVQTVQQECTQIQQQQTLAVLTLQSQQSAIAAQQVALQQSLQHVPVANALALGAGHGTVTQLGVSQASLQNAQLQLGGLTASAVATSIPSAVFHTPMTSSMPGVLTTNQSGQLQMLPGPVLTQPGTLGGEVVPGLLDPSGGLRTMVTTSTMILQPSTQLVYTQALHPQHHLVHSGQSALMHGGTINGGLQLTAQQQMAVANQMALQARTAQVTTQPQQLGLAPTTFYLVSQGSMLGMAAAGQMPEAAVQMQLGCTADALAQAQLAQVQVQQAQAQAQARVSVQLQNQQRQQQQQQNQQQQFQARAMQVGGPMSTVGSVVGPQMSTSYPYQISQSNGVSTVGSLTSSTVTYPHFRTRTDAMTVQKRKFQEDMPIRDGYMHGMASLRGQNQTSSLSSSTSPVGQLRPQHYSTITTTATSGFQSNLASGSIMPPYLMAAQESGNLSAPDREQKSVPPPLHAFQGGNNALNGEMQRKRLKSGLFNNSSYTSSEEDDGLSLNARRMQRNPTMRHRGFGGFDGELSVYAQQRRANDELHAMSVGMSQQQQQQSSQSLPGQYCGSLNAVPHSQQSNLPPASVAQQQVAANLSSALYASFPEHLQQQQQLREQLATPSITAIGYGQRYQYQSQF